MQSRFFLRRAVVAATAAARAPTSAVPVPALPPLVCAARRYGSVSVGPRRRVYSGAAADLQAGRHMHLAEGRMPRHGCGVVVGGGGVSGASAAAAAGGLAGAPLSTTGATSAASAGGSDLFGTVLSPAAPLWRLLLSLPLGDKLRLLLALAAAGAATCAVYEALRFELVYYGLWNRRFRHDADAWVRAQYYVATAVLGAGLSGVGALSFLLSSALLGRVHLGATVLSRATAKVLPQRANAFLARRTRGVVLGA